MRELAWEYAQKIQPWRTNLDEVYRALELSTLCGNSYNNKFQREAIKKLERLPGVERTVKAATTFFVDGNTGSDNNPGTINMPFKTIEYGISKSRLIQGPRTLYLRKGVYYISNTISLGPVDSQLTISNYNNEVVEISGAVPLTPSIWTPYKVSPQPILEEYTGSNNVYGRVAEPGINTTSLRCLGKFIIVDDCRTACQKFKDDNLTCYAYTYHSTKLNSTFAGYCYADITQTWGPNVDSPLMTTGRWVQYNIWETVLSQSPPSIPGLQLLNGAGRITRARWPSADTETSFFPDGWIHRTQSWIPPRKYPPSVTVEVQEPTRFDNAFFPNYSIGIGGSCSIFSPPESYWCSKYNDGGGPGLFQTPQGLTYLNGTFLNTFFEKDTTAIAHVWHSYHWSMWMYKVDSIDPSSRTIKWSYGGFQGARGSVLTGGGSEWYLENELELLDTPNEYYYDVSTSRLYLFYNGTTAPPSDFQLMTTNLKILIQVVGSQEVPVQNLTISGIKFTGGAYTYLDPHGVPSGGDWAMQRQAFVFFEGTENLILQDSLFLRLDGISVMLSGYNRGAVIQRNEFAWTGESAVAAWGFTNGIDGLDGNQPRGTQFLYNMIREIGMYEKQSSAWFQAKSCQTLIQGNIIFNGPRALININDGFGGANELTNNLLFNANRETSDQGPINTWDRVPFLTNVGDGQTPSLIPAYNEIHHNFFICNYGSNMCIDNDDGSSYYLNHDNFEVYGGHKSVFGGHNKFTFNSINAYSKVYTDGVCCDIEGQPPNFVPNFVDGYYNNSCVQAPIQPYMMHSGCDPNHLDPKTLSIAYDNRIYNANAKTSIVCNETEIAEDEWQLLGFDPGTVALPLPPDSEIIGWARIMLGLN
jgi:hypothetical protein